MAIIKKIFQELQEFGEIFMDPTCGFMPHCNEPVIVERAIRIDKGETSVVALCMIGSALALVVIKEITLQQELNRDWFFQNLTRATIITATSLGIKLSKDIFDRIVSLINDGILPIKGIPMVIKEYVGIQD